MSSDLRADRLHGRRHECESLDSLIATVRTGRSQVLVLRGEPGVGKSALLDYLPGRATGCRVFRSAGIESEMELAYAGLHQLCTPALDELENLPGPQRDALGTAFGLSSGPPPDRFMVGLAVLSLMSLVGDQQPLICLIDDAQWLDQASAQTLAFVARRLLAEHVAVVFAVREPSEHQLSGLPDLLVEGLSGAAARALLDSVITVDPPVRDRIVAETRGNPLALLELPRGLTGAELAFGFGVQSDLPTANLIEEGFRRRLAVLPAPSRQLLLTAAVEPVGDVNLLWRAMERLGIGPAAATAAASSGLIELGGQVRFRHPLVRSAVYRSADVAELQRVHRALAEVTDPDLDPDRRAWHLAQAAIKPDESVAGELEQSAGRAQTRGGLAAAAAFLQASVGLTLDPQLRANRALAAAQSKNLAGDPDAALNLLAMAQAGPLDELGRARADLLHGQIAHATRRGSDAPPLLLKAAKQFERLDIQLARETYLDAFSAALFAGRLATGGGSIVEVAQAVAAADWGDQAHPLGRGCDLLLDGLALIITQGYPVGTPLLKQALTTIREQPMSDEESLRWLWLACRIARAIGDDVAWDELTNRQVQVARRAGALSVLPIALTERFSAALFSGKLAEAMSLVAELEAVTDATGNQLSPHIAFLLATWHAREAEALTLIKTSRQDVIERGEGLWLIATEWTSSVFFNSLGRYEDALLAAERAAQHPWDLGLSTWVTPELVEAAVRSGHPERAAGAMARLHEIAHAAGTDWALGIEARARALLSPDETAEALYREAIERLGRTCVVVTLARAHLLYGEWLRRQGRRVDAREQLRTAHQLLTDIGMDGYAERARRELLATGETVRKRTVDTLGDFTAQEAQIARLAAKGRTNPEIGAELFISPRTVEWHLRKVFGKLGVTSRRELRAALPQT
jgi:DNA-binding CsgD family transcriptional regulator